MRNNLISPLEHFLGIRYDTFMSKNSKKRNVIGPLKKRFFTVVLFATVAIAFFYALSLSNSSCLTKGQWCGEDMDQYKDYSDNLLSGHGYSSHKVNNMYFVPLQENIYIPETVRHPGYTIVLTIGRLISNTPYMLLILNLFFYVSILYFSYKIAITFLKNKWLSLLTLIFISFDATLLYFTTRGGNADIFAAFSIAGFTYFFLKISILYSEEKAHVLRNTIIAGIFGVCAVMSRDNTSYFVLGIIGLTLLLSKIPYGKFLSKKFLFICFLIVLMSLIAWSVRIYGLTGKILFSTEMGTQLFDEHIIFALVTNSETNTLAYWYEHTAWKYVAEQRKLGVSIPRVNAIIDVKLQNMTLTYIARHIDISWQHFVKATFDIFSSSPFYWEKFDSFFILKNLTTFFGKLYLYTMLLFPSIILFVKNKKSMTLVFSLLLWFVLFSFLLLSAFFHGTIMGTRGSFSVLPITVMLVIFYFQQLALRIIPTRKGN